MADLVPGNIGWLSWAGVCRFRYIIVRACRGGFRVSCWNKRQPQQFRGQRSLLARPADFFWRES